MARRLLVTYALLLGALSPARSWMPRKDHATGCTACTAGRASARRALPQAAGAADGADSELVRARADATKAKVAANEPFSEEELDHTVQSFINVAGSTDAIDAAGLKALLRTVAHRSHKDWTQTDSAATALAGLVGGPADETFRQIFRRVLDDGNWDGGEQAACNRQHGKPWAVLVTGVNGIRKTTSVHEPWFQQVLAQALVAPKQAEDGASLAQEDLPSGKNSFFRQLDYMIATVANGDFSNLYEVDEVGPYAALKDSIFARYRTLAEMLGALLVKEAKERRMNVMVETSGRDIAMFRYIDYFFPDEQYNKLVVHFTVNDLGFAEASVDGRMLEEMAQGKRALASNDVRAIIDANQGGPYGSEVLQGVQADSDDVWEKVSAGADVGVSWYKARIAIEAHAERSWQAKAAGSPQLFDFTPRQAG